MTRLDLTPLGGLHVILLICLLRHFLFLERKKNSDDREKERFLWQTTTTDSKKFARGDVDRVSRAEKRRERERIYFRDMMPVLSKVYRLSLLCWDL